MTADVGVDDEKDAKGSVTFEIWADGTKVASSGLLTTADAAEPLTADVSGASSYASSSPTRGRQRLRPRRLGGRDAVLLVRHP